MSNNLRREWIRTIEALWPADSDYPDTAALGREFLQQARENVGRKVSWRDEPDEVLREYCRLCLAEEWGPFKDGESLALYAAARRRLQLDTIAPDTPEPE